MHAIYGGTATMYYYKKAVDMGFNEAQQRLRSALQQEGFGVLTEIDVQATLKEKLNVAWEPYLILGACNPPFAHKALEAEHDLGLLLPCNTIVYSKDGKVFVAAVLPTVQLGKVGNPALMPIAQQIEEKLKRVIDAV